MKSKIQKWGNSLALRIPKALALELKVREGRTMNLRLENGKLVLEPEAEVYHLTALLSEIHADNLHTEIQEDTPKGKEVW